MTLKIRYFLCILLFCPIVNLYPQSVTFPDDANERGYYNRPYKRYEAEAGRCITNGNILPAGFDQSLLQSEASNQVATQLISQNSYIELGL